MVVTDPILEEGAGVPLQSPDQKNLPGRQASLAWGTQGGGLYI